MAGTVTPERSDAPQWMKWLTVTVLTLLAILLVGLVSLAYGNGTVFIVGGSIALVVATFVLPVWAVFGLDTSGE